MSNVLTFKGSIRHPVRLGDAYLRQMGQVDVHDTMIRGYECKAHAWEGRAKAASSLGISPVVRFCERQAAKAWRGAAGCQEFRDFEAAGARVSTIPVESVVLAFPDRSDMA